MLRAYAASIDAALRNCLVIAIHSFQIVELSPTTGYIEGEALLVDGSHLVFFEFLRQGEPRLEREKYRYHYMDGDNQLIFRYDNAPHHSEVATFPHHNHTSLGADESTAPDFATVLAEVEKAFLGLP